MAAAPGNKGHPLPPVNHLTSHLSQGTSTIDNPDDTFSGRCLFLANLIKPTYGPAGLKIMAVNRLNVIKITGDCNTIFDQLETNGPDAKIITDYVKMMYNECGDGCKLLMILASELMIKFNTLISKGLTRTEILNEFQEIEKVIPGLMKSLTCEKLSNLLDRSRIVELIQKAVCTKVTNYSHKIASLVYDSSINALYPTDDKSKANEFSPEFVRVCKILGGSIEDSYSMAGLFLDGKPSGSVLNVKSTKVAIFSCPFDYNRTEVTAKVHFKSSAELSSFSKDEEEQIESTIKGLADAGIGLVVASGKSNDMMLHFANKYNIMVVNVSSKWMIRRLCVALDAKPLVYFHVPQQENLGTIDSCQYHEINEEDYVEFSRKDSKVYTVVLFGTTEQLLGMAENGVSSGVNFLRIMARDSRLVAGGGAFEIQLAKRLRQIAIKDHNDKITSFVYEAFADILENLAAFLIENSGVTDPDHMVSDLMSKHRKNHQNAGSFVNEDLVIQLVDDVTQNLILDPLLTKQWAITYALNAIDQMARINFIIMARSSDFNIKPRNNWDNLHTDV